MTGNFLKEINPTVYAPSHPRGGGWVGKKDEMEITFQSDCYHAMSGIFEPRCLENLTTAPLPSESDDTYS